MTKPLLWGEVSDQLAGFRHAARVNSESATHAAGIMGGIAEYWRLALASTLSQDFRFAHLAAVDYTSSKGFPHRFCLFYSGRFPEAGPSKSPGVWSDPRKELCQDSGLLVEWPSRWHATPSSVAEASELLNQGRLGHYRNLLPPFTFLLSASRRRPVGALQSRRGRAASLPSARASSARA
jgi:hypothetical protein